MDNYVYLRYRLSAAAQVVVRILDARGREVTQRDLGLVIPEVGFNEYVWNHRDNHGAMVAAGVYWATMEIDGSRSVIKITVVH